MDTGLKDALKEFARLVVKPVPPGAREEPTKVEHTGKPFRPMNMNVSPNQFALPGMEHQAHPLAKHLAEGLHFAVEHEVNTTPEGGFLEARLSGALGRDKPPPRSVDPPIAEHSLYAMKGDEQIGELHWKGNKPVTRSSYPGEVSWVRRNNRPEDDDGELTGAPPAHRGVMADMFAAGHETFFGQKTVPVHSPDRSPEGERWSAKIGPPELRPRRGQDFYRPPAGIHPFEKAEAPEPAREYRVDVIGPTRQQHFFDGAKYDRDPF